jgi:HK97 family phage prohead protease
METKLLSLECLSLKMADDQGAMKFAGYASMFGGVDAYGDTIDPKAYDRTIKRKKGDRPIRMRWNHFGPVIGKWTDIRTDESGLYVEGELTPGHSIASDVYASMKHGAVDGMSIGYYPKKIEMLGEEAGKERRLLKEIELVEISVVEDPADLGAKIEAVKSAIEDARSLKEIEAILRDAGRFSRADACALVARIKSLARGERDAEAEAKDLIDFARSKLYLG